MLIRTREHLSLLVILLSTHIAYAGSELVDVNFYGEALCPYCARFIDNTAWKLYANGIMNLTNFRYVPWGNAHFTEDGAACQHGPSECGLNRILSCAIHLHPQQNDWFPFAKCVESRVLGKQEPIAVAAPCANETRLDFKAIQDCADGEQGDKLQQQAANETAGLRPPHSYVPWVTVDGIPIGGAYEQLQTFICANYKGKRPDTCYGPPQMTTTSATYTNLKQILVQIGKEQHVHGKQPLQIVKSLSQESSPKDATLRQHKS